MTPRQFEWDDGKMIGGSLLEQRSRIVSVLSLALLGSVNGCHDSAPALPVSSPAASPAATPATAPSSVAIPASRAHNDTLLTTLPPVDAATTAAGVFETFRFTLAVNPAADPWDYFVAKASATTSEGVRIDTVCRWVKDGITDVRVQSDLTPEQHARVLSEIRKTLLEASTQPVSPDEK